MKKNNVVKRLLLLACAAMLMLSGCGQNPAAPVTEAPATEASATAAPTTAASTTAAPTTAASTTEVAEEPIWVLDRFVDVFGDKTGSAYVTGVFVGEYDDSQSREAAGALKIVFKKSPKFPMFELYKGMSGVTLRSSEKASLQVKTEKGTVKEFTLTCTEDGVFFTIDSELRDLIINNNPLSWAISISGGYSKTAFRFKTYSDGLKELLSELDNQ